MRHEHILVVDDEEILLRSLERALTDHGYRVTTAGNAREAIEQARSRDFDLVICDIRLPETDGLQAVRDMKPLQPSAANMLITGYASMEKPVEAIQLGVDDYLLKPFDLDDFLKRVERVIEKRRSETAREKLAASLEDSLVECLKRLVEDWENEDPFRKGHSDLVVKQALTLGAALGLSTGQLRTLGQAAALHDLGYVALGREILHGSRELSPEQWKKVRTHPARGAELLAPASSMKAASEAIAAHHENFDGTGYPNGLAGEAIPLLARILRIADMYSALISPRPHRPACDHRSACKLIEEASGTKLDPVFASLFLEEDAGQAAPDLARTARSVLSEFNSRNYRSLLLLARTYGGAGDPESAQQAYTELLSLSRAQRDSEIVFHALIGLATTGLQQNRAEEAARWSRLALEEALQAKESRNTALGLAKLALCEVVQGTFDNAGGFLEKAVSTLSSQDDPEALARVKLYHALWAARTGDASQALHLLEEAASPGLPGIGELLREEWQVLQAIGDSKVIPEREWGIFLEKAGFAPKSLHTPDPTKGPPASVAPPGLKLCFLGSFRTFIGDQWVREDAWRTRKVKYLFAYLAFHREKAIHEDRLLDLFWPDCPPNRARKNLSNALYHLRQALGPAESAQWVVREKSLYRTSLPPTSTLDTDLFTARFIEARRLHSEQDSIRALSAAKEAKHIFAGHFLEENLDDDWVLEPRQRFLDMFLEVLLILAENSLKTGNLAQAAQHARKALDENSTHERAHAVLIESLWKNGKRDEAVRHYHRCAAIFKEELGLSPPPDVVALYLRLTTGAI